MNILNIEYLGHVYTAQYKVTKDDHLVVHLPNGEMRETALRGIRPQLSAKTHLGLRHDPDPQPPQGAGPHRPPPLVGPRGTPSRRAP